MAAPLIAVVGPTGAGKSALALRLARACGGEIVSCDSLQVYRGFDIGSAKATPEERSEIPHHLLDVVDPDQPFSAAEYARRAREALPGIVGRGRVPIVAGGTGLYLRALLEGLFEGPSRDEGLRSRLTGLARRYGDQRLHRLLARVDPEAAARIPAPDRVRVVRALEVFGKTGRTLSAHHRARPKPLPGFSVLVVGLQPAKEALRSSIESRTRAMFERGLLDEVRGLRGRYGAEIRPLGAIGYRQAAAVLEGRLSPEEARRDIVSATLKFAKRQMTWFRHQARVGWHADADAALAAAGVWLQDQAE